MPITKYEREPQTAVYSGPFPQFNIDLHGIRNQSTAGLKTDFQFTPKTHMSARVNGYTPVRPAAWRGRRDNASVGRVAVVAYVDAVLGSAHACAVEQQGE